MKLTILGTSNALVTKCYNTCFVLSDNNRHLLVDGGGGSEILARLEKAEIDWHDIKDIFVTTSTSIIFWALSG
ncbi:MAG: MBL fold metallo-hydrolase [Bifidobacterium pseudocatenulatum]